MRRAVIVSLVGLAVLVLAFVGWRTKDGPPPYPPSVTGVVSAMVADEILVTHDEDECGGMFVSHDSETDVLRESWLGYEKKSWDDLEPGQSVRVWSGGVDDSCPGQALAVAVVVSD